MTIHIARMSLTDFMRDYDRHPFEFINGEIIPVSPSAFGPTRIANRLAAKINAGAGAAGEAYVEAVFVLTMPDDGNWLKGSRVPDVLYVPAEAYARFKADHPDWENKPLILVPPLVVEIVSPTDRFHEVTDKVDVYLADGVVLVWVIDPAARGVWVFEQGTQHPTRLRENDTLSAAPVIAGLLLRVSDLFAD